MKLCTTCNVTKKEEDFSKNRRTKDGLQAKCKSCSNDYRKNWAKENPEKARENSLKQTATLKERNPDYWRQWYAKDYATEEGRLKWIARVQKRRAMHLNAEGSFTAEEFDSLCKKYGNICLCCKKGQVALTADHVIPLTKGGTNWITNIQPLCRSCNSKKRVQSTDFRLEFAF